MTMSFSRRFRRAEKPATDQTAHDQRSVSQLILFENLFKEYWEQVCSVVYRLVGDWSEAEDIALDAFWQLYQKPPREVDNLGGWLYRVATNLGYNALRARRRRQRYEEEAGMQVLESDPSWNPVPILEAIQERERVREALSRMKPRSAKLLILRHSGFSYAEIAAALQISPASVGTLLARAEDEFEDRYGRPEGA
jgi:RNA polymerase sigma-70 factor (ECF subfamily)